MNHWHTNRWSLWNTAEMGREREREGGREGRKRSGRRNGKELRRDTMHQKAGVIINSFYSCREVNIDQL